MFAYLEDLAAPSVANVHPRFVLDRGFHWAYRAVADRCGNSTKADAFACPDIGVLASDVLRGCGCQRGGGVCPGGRRFGAPPYRRGRLGG